MKSIRIGLLLLTIVSITYSQAPIAFNYQAILRNSDGTIKAKEPISLQISIVDDEGVSVYEEVHNIQTNDFGLANLVIGGGDTGDDLSTVDWEDGPYFIDIEVDGTSLGSSPLLSVPYALYAAVAPQGDPVESEWKEASQGISYVEGLVGIGTSSPQKDLHVHNENANSTVRISNNHPAGSANNILQFSYENEIQASLIVRGPEMAGGPPNALNIYTQKAGAPVTIGTESGEKIRILDNGKIGIGTDMPTAELDVDGDLRIRGDILADGGIYVEALLDEIQMMRDMLGIGSVTDIDGNIYKTVKIGDQIWMAENLKVTHYNDGSPIDTKDTFYYDTGELMWYNFDIQNKDIYGGLYLTEKDVCPIGWHVSTNADWIALEDYLGGADIAAGKLIETGTEHWIEPNENATNETGFTALPGGTYIIDFSVDVEIEPGNWEFRQTMIGLGNEAYFWSPDYQCPECPPSYEYNPYYWRTINSEDQNIYKNTMGLYAEVIFGASIRCVKD